MSIIQIKFQECTMILPTGFTFAYRYDRRSTVKPAASEICIMRFMAINWRGGGYAYGMENYRPVHEDEHRTVWRWNSCSISFPEQFIEGYYAPITPRLFEEFKQTKDECGKRRWQDLGSPQNDELFYTLDDIGNRPVIWVNEF